MRDDHTEKPVWYGSHLAKPASFGHSTHAQWCRFFSGYYTAPLLRPITGNGSALC